ncbi:protein PTCD3 homolog, mitochondrial [Macrosteles quadrilineatus]|uniref:protein PTCD3 homolog, mitochondrial n=1 Tax=Macrosteles quadrilineatus TaxID=74068 RepID=UPI0023E22AD5|nr:protein PTCD3 homolog, mitochondrial [Macrosteles quadrilineatus]
MNSLQSVSSLRYSVKKSLDKISKQQITNISKQQATSDKTKNINSNKVIIPKRIERGPTDVLKAIASTVKRDYLAPHYKYHDDPFLIPTSNIAKRMFALSQESGRKAAHWVRQEHADLFQHRVADPPIEPYFPKAIYDENSQVDENVLKKLIEQHLVSDSLTVHGLLKEKGIEISRDTLQSLLELVCYYNEEDPLEEDWIEERWFKQDTRGRDKKINSWKTKGVAEMLFESLSPPDAAAYSALICGMVQAGNMAGAYKHFQEALDQGMMLPLHVYNKLITAAPTLKEGYDLRWQFVEDMLGQIRQQGLFPDLGTLNAALEVLSSMNVHKNAQKNALALMTEFRNLGIDPSLTSYYYLLIIFCKGSSIRSSVLINILDILEGKSLTIRDPRDIFFFTEAMDNCRYHLNDVEAAYRLDKLLHTGDNYNLIGDSFKESIYYRNYFALVCQSGSISELMKLYDKLVPHVYVPEPGIMELIIKTAELHEAWELLPRLWSDLVVFDQASREQSLVAMLAALQHSVTTDENLLAKHADVAWAIYTRVEAQQDDDDTRDRFRAKISWTGQMLGDILEVLLRADRYEEAVQILNCLEKRQNQVLGVPSIRSLSAFLDKSIEKKQVKNALWCIQYCYDVGFEETVRMAQNLNSSVKLEANDYNQLVTIVGKEPLTKLAAIAS